jgi:hypothetical protein
MFAVYCPGHSRRVLLFAEHIERLVNRADGIEVHWRCTCGTAGTDLIGRRHPELAEVA